jgi:RHS repeat-associated protein
LRFAKRNSNERTSAITYNIQLKIEFFDKNKVLKSNNVQVITLNASAWENAVYQLPTIQDNTIYYVKFSIINPNSFAIYLDNWKIEEKGKVILQENHYYPYGKEIVSLGKKGTHEFLYQGKERNEEFGLEQDDFEWRMYDFNFPRTTTIDPHAEKYVNWSPYSWVAGNPINIIDPDGRDTLYIHLKRVETPKENNKNTVIFKLSFSIVQDGVESSVSDDSEDENSDMYLMILSEYWKGGNKWAKENESEEFSVRFEDYKEYKNSIRIKYINKNLDRILAHYGKDTGWSIGCAIPTTSIGEFKDFENLDGNVIENYFIKSKNAQEVLDSIKEIYMKYIPSTESKDDKSRQVLQPNVGYDFMFKTNSEYADKKE